MNDMTLLLLFLLLLMVLSVFAQWKINQYIYEDFCEWFEKYQKTDEWKYEYEEKNEFTQKP